MPLILNLETATKVCSVAIGKNGKLVALKEINEDKSHSSSITLFIQEVLKGAHIALADLDAIAVSKGPGSFTGLRIGVSTAKGLCYALDKPLIAVSTLQAMANDLSLTLSEGEGNAPSQFLPPAGGEETAPPRYYTIDKLNWTTSITYAKEQRKNPTEAELKKVNPVTKGSLCGELSLSFVEGRGEVLFCPMIDAKRMEVYTAFYDKDNKLVREISADIIDENSYRNILNKNKVIFFGDGAAKCKDVLSQIPNAIFAEDIFPSAKNMIPLSENAFNKKRFENVAYFEPYYLKDFVAGIAKKNLFH